MEQEDLLEHEEFIKKVLDVRERDNGDKSNFWLFMHSPGGAALLTGLIIGVFATLISGSIQTSINERTHQNELDKALIAEQIDITQKTVELAAKTVVSADNLIATLQWNLDVYSRSQVGEIRNMQNDIIKTFNETKGHWDQQRNAYGFLLSYHHNNDSSVANNWHEIQSAIGTYLDCATQHAEEYAKGNFVAQECEEDEDCELCNPVILEETLLPNLFEALESARNSFR